MNEESVVNWELINTYLGEDKDFQKQMIEVFISNMPQYFEELEEAYANQNIEAIGKQAHKMKSSLSMLGVEKAQNYAIELESMSKQSNDINAFKMPINELEDVLNQAILELKKAL